MIRDNSFIDLVDCTLRDGSYQLEFGFTFTQTRDLVTALERAGVGWIEAGHGLGLGAAGSGKVKSAESDHDYLKAARLGATTAKVGVFAMPAFATLDDVVRAADYGMDFIRVGVDAAKFRDGEAFVREAVKQGLHTTVFLMKSYSLSLADLYAHAPAFADWGADAVAVVDSAGGMVPGEVSEYVEALTCRTDLAVAFHGHNNMQLASANALAAAEAGATMLDASLRGIGRSSGNAQIEALAAALVRSGYDVGPDALSLCDVAAQFITRPETHNGVSNVDLVQGMARVHSGMQQRIDWAATVFGLDPATLTLAVGKAGDGLDMSEDAVMTVAERLITSARLRQRAVHERTRPVDQWRGEFGAAYIQRNRADEAAVRQRTLTWGRYLWPMMAALPRSVLEVGCNVGINLRALDRLIGADLYAVEPNGAARAALLADGILPPERLFDADASAVPMADGAVELSFTTGVLIHVPPAELAAAVDELYRVSSRYILMSEYFADQPEEKTYRGHEGLLFKRDFGKFMLDRHPDLMVVDYGFFWREAGASDNGNWWLFRKA